MEPLLDISLREDDVYLSSSQVRTMFGGVSYMTISRWLADPRVGFPRPIKISERNYWRRGAILEFLRRREAGETK